MPFPTWEYEAPEVRKTFRAATRFWAKLDDVPIYALGEYMGSIPEDALVDYGKAVVEVDPSYFASVKYKDGVKSIMRLEFAELEKTDERLKFDERWKVRY